MSLNDDMASLWSGSSSGSTTPGRSAKRSGVYVPLDSPEKMEAALDDVSRQLNKLQAEASAALLSPAPLVSRSDLPQLPAIKGGSVTSHNDQGNGQAADDDSGPTRNPSLHPWGGIQPNSETLEHESVVRVIEVPEWIASLNLLATQQPSLAGVCEDLMLIGRGFRSRANDLENYYTVGNWIRSTIGKVDVQLYSSRVSSLKKRIGNRTKCVGEEAVEINSLLPVRYFHSRVVSVRQEDIEEIAMKILASSGDIPSYSSVELGKGTDPLYVPGVAEFYKKLQRRTKKFAGLDRMSTTKKLLKVHSW